MNRRSLKEANHENLEKTERKRDRGQFGNQRLRQRGILMRRLLAALAVTTALVGHASAKGLDGLGTTEAFAIEDIENLSDTKLKSGPEPYWMTQLPPNETMTCDDAAAAASAVTEGLQNGADIDQILRTMFEYGNSAHAQANAVIAVEISRGFRTADSIRTECTAYRAKVATTLKADVSHQAARQAMPPPFDYYANNVQCSQMVRAAYISGIQWAVAQNKKQTNSFVQTSEAHIREFEANYPATMQLDLHILSMLVYGFTSDDIVHDCLLSWQQNDPIDYPVIAQDTAVMVERIVSGH